MTAAQVTAMAAMTAHGVVVFCHAMDMVFLKRERWRLSDLGLFISLLVAAIACFFLVAEIGAATFLH